MTTINKKVGEKICEFRIQKKLTQEQLAFKADLHRAYIGHVERGEKNIGLKNLEIIAKALGVSIKDLV